MEICKFLCHLLASLVIGGLIWFYREFWSTWLFSKFGIEGDNMTPVVRDTLLFIGMLYLGGYIVIAWQKFSPPSVYVKGFLKRRIKEAKKILKIRNNEDFKMSYKALIIRIQSVLINYVNENIREAYYPRIEEFDRDSLVEYLNNLEAMKSKFKSDWLIDGKNPKFIEEYK